MIDVSHQMNKLEALKIYMDFWLNEKHCFIRWWDVFNDTGILLHRPEWLPPFEQWYYEYGYKTITP